MFHSLHPLTRPARKDCETRIDALLRALKTTADALKSEEVAQQRRQLATQLYNLIAPFNSHN